jgi:nitroimidazol reductase NimA-like FMN-containing flavoprotein (pyridoxamine 5'-phosphate oxidase superfamily)
LLDKAKSPGFLLGICDHNVGLVILLLYQEREIIQGVMTMQEGWRPTREGIASFLNTQQIGRIGTCGPDGRPQIANVAFSENDDLELMIGTSETSRKAANIGREPRVAFEATDLERRYTVQFEGAARRLTSEEFETRADRHFKKLPSSLPYKDIKGQMYFVLEPSWVRFSDCSVDPWVVTEVEFGGGRNF